MIDLSRRSLLTGAAAIGTASAFGSVTSARAAAPVAGKQNAGWYRYKVGDFEVTVVTDGMNTNPLSDAYVSNAPKADVNAALKADFLAKDKVTHPYTPVVINTGSKLVAIDTGLGIGMFEQSKERSASIIPTCRLRVSTAMQSMSLSFRTSMAITSTALLVRRTSPRSRMPKLWCRRSRLHFGPTKATPPNCLSRYVHRWATSSG